MKAIQITNFTLTYDGMYFISWEQYKYRIFLELNTILKMLAIEGLDYEAVDTLLKNREPIPFRKVTMVVNGRDQGGKLSLRTSASSDDYVGRRNLFMIAIELAQMSAEPDTVD